MRVIANIGEAGRRRRRMIGLAAALMGVALLAVLVASGATRWWRLTTFVPYWAGSLGWLQAREKT
jgi:hypothetical protein